MTLMMKNIKTFFFKMKRGGEVKIRVNNKNIQKGYHITPEILDVWMGNSYPNNMLKMTNHIRSVIHFFY